MRLRHVALLVLAGCQYLHLPDAGSAGGRGGSGNGGGSGTGGGGAAGGGNNGGGAGGGGGFCVPSCDGGCGTDGCGTLCRLGVPSVCAADPVLCTLTAPMPSGALVSISGVDSDDFWVVSVGGVLFHWNGSQWACLAVPKLSPENLWASSRDVWVVGGSTVADMLPVFHYRVGDNAGTSESVPLRATPEQRVRAVWGSSDGGVWIATGAKDIARRGGGSWVLETPTALTYPVTDLDGTLTDQGAELFGATTGMFMAHRSDGGAWQEESLPAPQGVAGVWAQSDGGAWTVERGGGSNLGMSFFHAMDMWMPQMPPRMMPDTFSSISGTGAVPYVVGAHTAGGHLERRDPTLWWQHILDTPAVLRATWVAPNEDVWMTSISGEVIRYRPARCTYPTVDAADEFNTLSIRYASAHGTPAVSNGRLSLGAGPDAGDFEKLILTGPLNMTERSISVEIVSPAWVDGGSVSTRLEVTGLDAGPVSIERVDGTIVGIVGVRRMTDIDPGGPLLLKITDSSGVTSVTYVTPIARSTLTSDATPGGIDAVGFELSVTNLDGGAVVPAIIDNLNRCPGY